MCTGFTFQAKNGDVILGRTMDYDYPLTGHLLCNHVTTIGNLV